MRSDAIGLFWQDIPQMRLAKAPQEKRSPPRKDWLKPDYLPNLQEAIEFFSRDDIFLSDKQLIELSYSRNEVMMFDVEIYPNYFLVAFKHVKTGMYTYIESDGFGCYDAQKLQWLLQNFLVVSFNGNGFDIPICSLACKGAPLSLLMDATERIIVHQEKAWIVMKSYKCQTLECNHIDLIEVAPLSGSLKSYGGRLHCPTMQDLPFPPGTELSGPQIEITRWYCCNDLIQTEMMYEALSQELSLRGTMSQRYGMDLRSKSDAQIAEAVIAHSLNKLTRQRATKPVIPPGTVYRYQAPAYLRFATPVLQHAFSVVQAASFIVAEHGSIDPPPEFKELDIQLGGSSYTLQIGGLHSKEKKASHFANEAYELWDFDVTSYYPFIILNNKLYPKHLGSAFLIVYQAIVDERLDAKRNKRDADAKSLKIVINGSYGKLGSKYSIFYAPDLLIQTTLTGQLTLLMLIEWLEVSGISVVSANTDGIVIKPRKDQKELMQAIIKEWEKQTSFTMEGTQYKSLCSRDVNNYIAVKAEGGTKTKGAYANPWASAKDKAEWMHKNPTGTICSEAVANLLEHGIPISKTVMECTDIKKFVHVRYVKGGACKVWNKDEVPEHVTKQDLVKLAGYREYYGGTWTREGESDRAVRDLDAAYEHSKRLLVKPGETEFLGKVVRFYYSAGHNGELVYAGSGNKVPSSDGAVPMMKLPNEVPADIDYHKYIADAEKMLKAVGL